MTRPVTIWKNRVFLTDLSVWILSTTTGIACLLMLPHLWGSHWESPQLQALNYLKLTVLGFGALFSSWFSISYTAAAIAQLFTHLDNQFLNAVSAHIQSGVKRWGAPFIRTLAIGSLTLAPASQAWAAPNTGIDTGTLVTSSSTWVNNPLRDPPVGSVPDNLVPIVPPISLTGTSPSTAPTADTANTKNHEEMHLGHKNPATPGPADSLSPSPSPNPSPHHSTAATSQAESSPSIGTRGDSTHKEKAEDLGKTIFKPIISAKQPIPDKKHIPQFSGPTHTVLPGESLWSIAKKELGPNATNAQIEQRWRSWWSYNRQVIGSNPDLIFVSSVLTTPPKEQS